jgi:hypothetical protein
MILQRILIDGGLLTALVAPVLVFLLWYNPRIALSDYPPDVQAAVPPRTRQELRLGILFSLPLLALVIIIPLSSTWLIWQAAGSIDFGTAFITIFGVLSLPFFFDLLVLDILMFSLWTPRFVVIPGTEGMAGYKDYMLHVKGHLRGLLIMAVFAALLALIPVLLY